MQRTLWLPILVLALGVAAIGGFAGAAWALSDDGDGAKDGPSAVEAPAREDEGEAGEDLLERGPAESEENEPGYLGVVLNDRPDLEGVLVARVAPRSPAARAGFEADDVITAVDGERVDDPDELVDIVTDAGPGAELTFTIERDGDERELEASLAERPLDMGELMPRILPEAPGDGRLEELLPFLEDLRPFEIPRLDLPFDGAGRFLERFVRAELVYLNDEGETETVRALAGAVESMDEDELVLAPKDSGADESFDVSDDTRVWGFQRRQEQNGERWLWRLFEPLELDDVDEGDQVVVVARDDEAVAILVVEAS